MPLVRIGILTREYPPDVYGGAGVHVDFLVRELVKLADVDVHCMGEPRPGRDRPLRARPDARGRQRRRCARSPPTCRWPNKTGSCDIVHSHTWYANMGGHWAKLLYDIPHVVTSHSLEPQRPWKAEQLGGGYRVSSWAERTAYEAADAVIAVSHGSRRDVMQSYPNLDEAKVHVVHNGIDTDFYRPDPATDVLDRLGVDPDRPSVVFVGRITRQKGVPHLLRAALQFDQSAQLVLLAGAADTPELAAETDDAVATLRANRDAVFLVSEMLPREEVRQVLTHGDGVRVSVGVRAARDREPRGDGVRDGGRRQRRRWHPRGRRRRRDGSARALPGRRPRRRSRPTSRPPSTTLIRDPARATAMGVAGRKRAVDEFGWDTAARRTMAIYESVL